MFTTFIHFLEIILWITMFISVAYVMFYAIVSLLPKKIEENPFEERHKAAQPRRFLVIFPAYAEDSVILESVKSFLQQDYPSDSFHITVVSDHMSDETNIKLLSLPITLLTPVFEKSSKAEALKYAMQYSHSDYDNVVILDADNIVENDFLRKLNLAHYKGYDAIQCHRCAKNMNNSIATLDAVSEEINNTLFRMAHNRLFVSSALIGSGMSFDYDWFRKTVKKIYNVGEDRDLEIMLIKSCLYTKYEEDIHVFDEKVSSMDSFQGQRRRWMLSQFNSFCYMIPRLPKALKLHDVDFVDLAFQQMLIPRSILLAGVLFMAIITLVVIPAWSIKWWVLLCCLSLSLLVATPARLRTKAVFCSLTAMPALVWRMLCNVRHLDKNNKDFIHTPHNK